MNIINKKFRNSNLELVDTDVLPNMTEVIYEIDENTTTKVSVNKFEEGQLENYMVDDRLTKKNADILREKAFKDVFEEIYNSRQSVSFEYQSN